MSNPTDLIERLDLGSGTSPDHFLMIEAAAELRRLHEVNRDLLETLKDIAKSTTPSHPISRVARPAIAKAEGESNE